MKDWSGKVTYVETMRYIFENDKVKQLYSVTIEKCDYTVEEADEIIVALEETVNALMKKQ